MVSDLDKKIESWRKKLLDLSKRNKMINFKETKTKSLPLQGKEAVKLSELLSNGEELFFRHKPEKKTSEDPEEGPNNENIDEDKEDLKSKKDITEKLKENEVISTRSDSETENSLYKLYLKQRESVREKGVDTFYLALGMLNRYEAEHSDKKIRSPLLFIPVNLNRETNRSPDRFNYYVEFKDDEVLLNPALKKKLQDDFNFTLPEGKKDLSNLENFFQDIEDAVKSFQRWKVSYETILGIFDFTKFALYEDLEENKERIKKDPIVQAINDNPEALQNDPTEVPDSDELDEKVSPKETFQVLDADSSQQKAIEAAKEGVSFVLQGPPGTGKSQTIANIIAEKLAQGEKVLFVSEKKAALDVVKKRLDEARIGRFCLEVHGDKASKKDVLSQIEKEYNNYKKPTESREEREKRLEKLKEKRDKLNEYGRLLFTKPGSLGKTPYDVQGELAALNDLPRIEMDVDKPLSITQEEFEKQIANLKGLQDFSYEVNHYQDHPWKQAKIESWQIGIKEKMKDSLEDQDDAIQIIQDWAQELQRKLEIKIKNINDFTSAVNFVNHLVNPPDFNPTKKLFESPFYKNERQLEKLSELVKKWKELEENLDEKYSESIHSENGEYLRKEITSYGMLRFIKPSYHNIKNRIIEHTKESYSPGFNQLKEDMKKLENLQQVKEKLSNLESLQSDLHDLYQAKETDWELVKATADWMREFHSFERFEKDKVVDLMINEKQRLFSELKEKGNEILEKWNNAVDFYQRNIEVKKVMINRTPMFETDFSNLTNYYSDLMDDISRLRDWVQFTNALSDIKERMTKTFLDNFFEEELEAENLVKIFKKAFYTKWLNVVYEKQNFDDFNRAKYDRLLSDFQKLDKEQLKIAQVEIIDKITQRRPSLDLDHNQTSEQAILKREMEKQSRHMPLRKLFNQTENLVTKIKPCFMMSPLSVAQHITSDSIDFDVVVFDEASQIKPQDAISSLVRADQAIVVGDSKQLPPTTFFETEVESSRDAREDLESILKETSAVLPEEHLLWHYRSNSEELINFSNHQYYDNRLLTFPSNKVDKNAIKFEYVEDGLYDRGGSSQNIPEAKKVADKVEKLIEKYPEKTIGIVAFSSSQETAIQEELERRRSKNPSLNSYMSKKNTLEDFFVKRLEVVQGDERDIMIFSVGYGPDESGKIYMNFGPLNHSGGERRLNVAITRAREKVIVISSLQPNNIDLSRTESIGVEHFKKYLEYAKNGENVLARDDSYNEKLEFDSSFEKAVYNALTEEGYDVVTQVESSDYSIDLAIKHPENPGEFILGVECDGAAYHSSKTARDRDRIRQSVLERLGWNIHRIWSPDWIANKDREINRIKKKIENLQKNSAEVKRDTEEDEKRDYNLEEIEPNNLDGIHQDIVQYKEPDLSFERDIDPDELSKGPVQNQLSKLVNIYGPIQKRKTYSKILETWNISRLGNRIKRKLDSFFSGLARSKGFVERKGFLWPPKRAFDLKVRKNHDEKRKIEEIAELEIIKAIYIILSNSYTIKEEDLIREIARIFGFKRAGKKIKTKAKESINIPIKESLADREGKKIKFREVDIDKRLLDILYE